MWTFLFMLASVLCLTLAHLLKTITFSQKINLMIASVATGIVAWVFMIFSSLSTSASGRGSACGCLQDQAGTHALCAVVWTAYLVLFWVFRKNI
jgi:hypothetical protein